MNPTLARRLVSLARRAYRGEAADLSDWRPRHLDLIDTGAFAGFVASDDHAAFLVFRGSALQLGSDDLLRRSLQAWFANLDFAQVEEPGAGMVHRGYARELANLGERLPEMVRDHALGGKPVYVTGHSAGGALAALAARRLHAAGADVRATVLFSAPRVGDRTFAASYPVPLLRIEHRHDLVPHLPLPPSLARLLGRRVLDPLIEAADWLSPLLSGARIAGTEYVHAGELIYDDGASTLYRVPPGHYLRQFGPLLWRELQADLLARGEPPDPAAYRAAACPRWATPVPARLMDGVRLPATLAEIGRQLRRRRLDFLLDHHIDRAQAVIDRIGHRPS